MPSRRDLLRGVGGVAALGTLSGTAGCLSLLNPISQSSGGFGGSGSAETALSAEEFETYTERMADRYGDAGVWGLGSAPETPSFVGAWTNEHETGGFDDEENHLAVADYAVACYSLGQRGDSNERHYRYWLWAAGKPTDSATVELPGGPYEVTPKLRGLGLYVRFDDGEQLETFDPDGDHTETGVVDVGGNPSDNDPVSGSFRLRQGTVVRGRPSSWDREESTGRETNDYAVGWDGSYDGVQSINAVCRTTRLPDGPTGVAPLYWETHVAAGGYR